ncbi:MAG: hypothetical protein ACE15D_00280 [Candidatus Eisenbacteria bacterium]|nr:hypothetical protein [Candidatus Eisenbacteria bacterium]
MHRRLGTSLLIWGIALLLIGFVGCSKDQATRPGDPSSPTTETPNLDDPLGGLTTQDELPAFGDDDLARSAGTELPVEDPFGSDATIGHWQDRDSTHVYAVTVLWGMLQSDPTIRTGQGGEGQQPVVDWSGRAEVNNGAIVVRSVIAFESDDHLQQPRTDRTSVDWVSHTAGDLDGIRFMVVQPFVDGRDPAQDVLTIVAGGHEYSFPLLSLKDLEFEEEVDDAGNAFALRSFLVKPALCTLSGFLGGEWKLPANPDSVGTFRGRWVNRDGSLAGFVRGYFGVDESGHQVLFGKVIDESGRFEGIVRGEWGQGNEPGAPGQSIRNGEGGWFRADWLDRDERTAGMLRGHWRVRDGAEEGAFEGRWAKGCRP